MSSAVTYISECTRCGLRGEYRTDVGRAWATSAPGGWLRRCFHGAHPNYELAPAALSLMNLTPVNQQHADGAQ